MSRKFEESGLPCPCGVSSDAYAIDHEGRGYCFSGNCDKPTRQYEKETMQEAQDATLEATEPHTVEYVYKSHRGLSKKTLEFYKLPVAVVDGVDTSYIFEYPNGSKKIKRLNPINKKDKYRWDGGEANQAGLYGSNLFAPGSKSSITITEGEHDAPSIFEVTGGSTAAVSVQSSSTAYRDIEGNRDYLNSFDKIILAFDNDEAGKNALRKIMSAGLFDFNKLYWVPFDKHKDANAYLQAGDLSDLSKVWKSAKKYTPDNIISTYEEIKEALKEAREEEIGTYPTERLTNMLYGFHRGQVVVVKGMEGIGKTEIFRMMEHHLLKTTKCKLGLIHMEEDKSTTIKGVATYELGIPCALPDSGVSEGDILKGYSQATGGEEDRIFLYTMFGGDDPDDVLDSIRFLVSSGGVDIVFLDHISILVTGVEEGDERRKLDYISTKLKKMCKELKFCLVMITHVNDEGQTRGSRNISKIADTVIDLSRDKLAEDEIEKNSLYISVEKNRMSGRTGKGGVLYFNPSTFKLEEVPS
jgi:twinkle protein